MMRRELVTGYIHIKGVKVKRVEEHRDRLLNIIKDINSLAPQSLIIVEGNTDEKIVRSLIYNQLEVLSYLKFKEAIARNQFYREFLILTDFDGEGDTLHKIIRKLLLEKGVKESRVRDDLRTRIRKILIIYGYSVYDALSNLKRCANIEFEDFKVYVTSDYSHLLYDIYDNG